VRRLVLVGTRPRGGQNMATLTRSGTDLRRPAYRVPEELWLKVHFTGSEASQAAGREFHQAFLRRTENRDPAVNEKVAPAQIEAHRQVGRARRKILYQYLETILQPALVVKRDDDLIIYSIIPGFCSSNIPNVS